MKRRNYLEMCSILSLSLLLTTALSVSSCLPEMLNTFSGYSRSSLELLMSIPAFAMMIVVASSPFLLKIINERLLVTSGLIIFGFAGMIPAFISSYPVILVSRILFGIGTGLINTRAISMIGERFTGELGQRLQGIRCSMETLGQAAFTLIAGQLLRLSWNASFLVYGISFIILIIYLRFVPAAQSNIHGDAPNKTSTYKLQSTDWHVIMQNFILGGIFVSASVNTNLRLTSYITDSGIGTDVNGATILSIATFVGFIGGLLFGTLIKSLTKHLFTFSAFMVGVGFIIIVTTDNLAFISVGAAIVNFFITNGISYLFNRLSKRLPKEALNTGNSIVIVGCNTGSFTTPFVLSMIGKINSDLSAGFWAYAALMITISCVVFLRNFLKK